MARLCNLKSEAAADGSGGSVQPGRLRLLFTSAAAAQKTSRKCRTQKKQEKCRGLHLPVGRAGRGQHAAARALDADQTQLAAELLAVQALEGFGARAVVQAATTVHAVGAAVGAEAVDAHGGRAAVAAAAEGAAAGVAAQGPAAESAAAAVLAERAHGFVGRVHRAAAAHGAAKCTAGVGAGCHHRPSRRAAAGGGGSGQRRKAQGRKAVGMVPQRRMLRRRRLPRRLLLVRMPRGGLVKGDAPAVAACCMGGPRCAAAPAGLEGKLRCLYSVRRRRRARLLLRRRRHVDIVVVKLVVQLVVGALLLLRLGRAGGIREGILQMT